MRNPVSFLGRSILNWNANLINVIDDTSVVADNIGKNILGSEYKIKETTAKDKLNTV